MSLLREHILDGVEVGGAWEGLSGKGKGLEEVEGGVLGGILGADLLDEGDGLGVLEVVGDRNEEADDGVELLLIGDGLVEDVVEQGLDLGLVAEAKLLDEQVQHLENYLTHVGRVPLALLAQPKYRVILVPVLPPVALHYSHEEPPDCAPQLADEGVVGLVEEGLAEGFQTLTHHLVPQLATVQRSADGLGQYHQHLCGQGAPDVVVTEHPNQVHNHRLLQLHRVLRQAVQEVVVLLLVEDEVGVSNELIKQFRKTQLGGLGVGLEEEEVEHGS